MALTKSKGNMYPWVTHTHAHLGGECPHKCVYCYVDNPRFGRPEKYTGELRLIENEFKVNYGDEKTIFVEHCNDMFAEAVPTDFIHRILAHCCTWPDNTYVFQTKNPMRLLYDGNHRMPPKVIIGTTIETNRDMSDISQAPEASMRYPALVGMLCKKFVTIEPILDFDLNILAQWMQQIKPDFINIGADSKRKGLPEPGSTKIVALIERLKKNGIEVREKNNLERLL